MFAGYCKGKSISINGMRRYRKHGDQQVIDCNNIDHITHEMEISLYSNINPMH